MIRLFVFMIFLITISTIFIGCRFFRCDSGDIYVMSKENVKIWKNTSAWNLALAVENEDIDEIVKIAKINPELLNFQEPLFGETLLIWSVGVEKYKSTITLLKCGANPNVATYYGETALFEAAGYSWIDNDAKKDPKYVNILLKYGADPNICYTGGDKGNNMTELGTSPLIESIMCGIEKTKSLVNSGADLNHKTASQRTAAIEALVMVGPNSTIDSLEYAEYLIVQKKANITKPYYSNTIVKGDDPNKKFYPVDLLRYWTFPLDSEEYKLKMKIVKEFNRQGVDYWKTTIDDIILNSIKEEYPDTWKEYIKKY